MIETVLGILLLVMAAILVVCVLCQESKDKRLSGAIAGGSDNFFGQGKGSKKSFLPKLTTAVSVIFIVVVVVMYVVTLTPKTTPSTDETDAVTDAVENAADEAADILDDVADITE